MNQELLLKEYNGGSRIEAGGYDDSNDQVYSAQENLQTRTANDQAAQTAVSDEKTLRGPLNTNKFDPEHDNDYEKINDLTLLDAFKKVSYSSMLPILQSMILTVSQSINLLILGHSENSISFTAAYGLGNMVILVSMQSLNFGLSNTLPQYVSQAYSVNDYKLCGIYRNRQLIINFSVITMTALVIVWCKPLFLLLNQTEEVANLAQSFVFILIPGQYCFGYLLSNQRFCIGQQQLFIPFLAQIIALFLQVITLLILSVSLESMFYAVAISQSMMFVFGAISIKIFIRYKQELARSDTSFFSPESFVNVLPQMRVALGGLAMVLWSMWAVEASVFLSAILGEVFVASQSILNTFIIQFHSLAMGIQSQMFIGYSLGQLNIDDAKKYTKASITLGLYMASTIAITLVIFKNFLISVISSSDEIKQTIESVYFKYVLAVFLLMAYETFKGITLGVNKQGFGSLVTLFANWAIAVPIEVLVVIYHWGFSMFWLGITAGNMLRALGLLVIVLWIDWDKTLQIYVDRRNLENTH